MTRRHALPAGWRQRLAFFPEDVGDLLGDCMARLAPALHGHDLTLNPLGGEPDGFDGLSRRGSYERLLASEWVLASAAPLEFMRRAADAEHAFLKLAERRPAARRGTLALFDTGPHQLGNCRVVALAILLLLVERAAARGAALGFQLLHQLGEAPFTTFDEHSVRAFVGGGTAIPCSPLAISDWRRRFPTEELWVIGPPKLLASAPKDVNAVALTERVTLGPALVDVQVTRARHGAKRLAVPIPEPEVTVRLLRDPFQLPPRSKPLETPAPSSNLLLSPAGNRLFFTLSDGRLAELAVPTSANHTLGAPRTHEVEPGMRTIAVGRLHGALSWLSIGNGRVTLATTEQGRRRHSVAFPAPVPPGDAALSPLAVFDKPRRAVFVTPDRQLFRVSFEEDRCEQLATGVLAVALLGQKDPVRAGGALAAVQSYSEHDQRPAVLVIEPGGVRAAPFAIEPCTAAHLRAVQHAGNETWTFAHERREGTICIEVCSAPRGRPALPAQHAVLSALPGTRVAGVDSAGAVPSDLGIYLLNDDGTQLALASRAISRDVLSTRSPIQKLAFASGARRIALLTRDGELSFHERSGKKLWSGRIAWP